MLGKMHGDGLGVPADSDKAREWYDKATAQGNADAQLELGLLYYYGRGLGKDYARSKELFQAAASQGVAEAQMLLAMHYLQGLGVQKDAEKASKMLFKACGKGFQPACDMCTKIENGFVQPTQANKDDSIQDAVEKALQH